MGLFSKLMGSGGTRCADCGRSFDPPSQLMNIMTADISRFSIDGMGGYCRSCRKYLCSKHLEFQQTDGSGFSWAVGCKSCGTSISTGP
jgi:hypothetical protein